MMKNTVVGLKKPFEVAEGSGAKRLIAEAVEAVFGTSFGASNFWQMLYGVLNSKMENTLIH